MADYINYGDLQIEKNVLIKELADRVPLYILSYVDSKPLSAKGKLKRALAILSAYEDIMNRGLVGASVGSNGQWGISVTNNPESYDEDIYGEAVNIITDIMKTLPTVASQEEQEKLKKSNLPIFDNNTFITDFRKYIADNYLGGRGLLFEINDEWNNLDKRNEKGERYRTERTKKLSLYLTEYRDRFDSSKFNFEGSPFNNAEDFKNRLNNAINALNSPELDDDNEALNRLGLNPKDWFNNGTGDIYTGNKEFNLLYNGLGTYGLYYNEYLPALLELKNKLLELKNKQLLLVELERKLNQYTRYQFYGAKPGLAARMGTPVRELYRGRELDYLKSLATKTDLTRLEVDELIGGFRLFEQLGKLSKLSKEELEKFGPSMKSRANNFRKIEGLEGFYWDPIVQRIVRPINENVAPLTIDSLSIFNLNSPEALVSINMNTPVGDFDITNFENFSPEMKKEIEALAWDAASILDPEAFSGSAMAIRAAYLRGLANPNRSTLESALDYGTGLLGGVQGAGDLLLTGKLGYRLYQLGKSIGSVTKFAGMLGAGFGAIGAYEARDSIAKITNPDSLTPLDLENIAYGLMGLIGLKSFAKARNKQTIGKQANPTVTEHNITIKDKNNETHEIKIDENTAKNIQELRTFGKKKETVDSEILNMPKIKESIEKYKIEGASIVNDSKIGRNKVVTSKQVKNPNAPEYAPVGTKYWFDPFFHPGYIPQGNNKFSWMLGGWQRKAWENATPEHSSKGLWLRAKELWSPEPKPILSKPKETPTATSSSTPPAKLSKEEVKELRETLKGRNFGTADFQNSNFKIKNLGDVSFITNKDGSTELKLTLKDGTVLTSKSSALDNIKLDNLRFLKSNLRKISELLPRDLKAKINVELIRKLKEVGALKQGGRIDKLKIQIYKKYIGG